MFNWQPGRNPFLDALDEEDRAAAQPQPVRPAPRDYPQSIQGPPRRAPLQAPAQDRNSNAQAGRTEREIGNMPSPEQAAQINVATVARAVAEAQRAQAEAVAAQQALERGGLSPDAFEQRRRDAQAKLLAAENLQRQLDSMRAIYSEHFEGWGPRSFGNSIFPTEPNQRFQAVADAMRVDLKPLIRLPGEGVWTDADQRLLNDLTPSPGNWDSRNEGTFNEIQARIDASRDRYAPEVQNSASGTNLSTGIYTNRQPERVADNQASVRQVEDPVRRGHAMEIEAMFNNLEIGDREILDYHARHFPNEQPTGLTEMLQRRRDRNSDVRRAIEQGRRIPMNPGWYTSEREATGLEQTMGAFLDTPVGTASATYLNSLLAGWGPDAAGLVGGDTESIRAGLEGARAQNPTSALIGDIGGAVGAYGAAGRIARNLNFMPNRPVARAVLGDAAYGASYGAGSNPDDRLGGAALGMTLQTGGGLAGRALFNTAGNLVGGVRNPSVQRLRQEGVPLTLGETAGQSGILGRMVQGVENAATSIPGVGRMVNTRQIEARTRWNVGRWNEALRPIGGRVSGAGEEASEAASAQVSEAYRRVFQGRTFTLDQPMDRALATQAARIPTMLPGTRDTLDTVINQQVRPMLQSGNVQGALQALRDGRAALASERGSRDAVRMLGNLDQAVQNLMRRQHPGSYQALRNADRAYRLVATAQAAQAAAMSNADSPGIFTPAQLGTASRQNANRFGGRDLAASRNRPFYQSQRDGQNVLPNSLPNSGTADRAALMGIGGVGALGGGEYMLGGDGTGTAGALGGLAALYSRGGQRLVNGMLAARSRGMQDFGNRATRQYFNVPTPVPPLFGPMRSPTPFADPMTIPQLGGIGLGTGINSMGGLQAEGRPFGPFQ